MNYERLRELADTTRDNLAQMLEYLAKDVKATAEALKRAKSLDEIRSAFNPLGELQDNRRIDNLCGRLAAYCELLAAIDRTAKTSEACQTPTRSEECGSLPNRSRRPRP